MITSGNHLTRDFRTFLACAGLLTLLGVVFVYSASSVYALEHYGSAHSFFLRHLGACVSAFIAAFCCYLVPLRAWQRYADLLFGLVLFAIALPAMGPQNNLMCSLYRVIGWLQPEALFLLALTLYVSSFLATADLKEESYLPYLPLAILCGFAGMILIERANWSVALLAATVMSTMFLAARVSAWLLAGLTGVLSAGALALRWWYPGFFTYKELFHHGAASSALVAIGSGGWWGAGVAYSEQKTFYTPGAQTDYVFAIIAEEVGFIGCVLIMCAYLTMAFYGLRLVMRLSNPFARYLTLGFTVALLAQVALNMAVVTGLCALQGLGLPFITFTHHSLLTAGCMVGLIANAVYEQRGDHHGAISHFF